ncbi:MAG: V-type ATP synthase subunit E family protein [Candidatus Wenzhouxiangella sp. M2_3B_020]
MSTPIETHESHNRASLESLLEHIDDRCRERTESIRRRAEEQADAIRKSARQKAAELLRETRRRERRQAHDRVRVERARQEGRIRQRQLALQRERAERGLEALREALTELWRQPAARAAWLERALADARAVLPGDEWRVRHPDGWAPDDDAERVASDVAPGADIEWHADSAVREGFAVESTRARVDASVDGLTARGERIAGVLLAELPEPQLEVDA